MIYAVKSYSEIYRKDLGKIKDYEELASTFEGQTLLGNFLKKSEDLYSYKEMYHLESELSVLNKLPIKNPNFLRIVTELYRAYEYIREKTEFINYNSNHDLYLFSIVKKREERYEIKIYELGRISPVLIEQDEIHDLMTELEKFRYTSTCSLLLMSNGYIESNDIKTNSEEINKIIEQKLISAKGLQLFSFMKNSVEKTGKGEIFFLFEKYLQAYH